MDVIWTLDEIGGDMHLMGIYMDIWYMTILSRPSRAYKYPDVNFSRDFLYSHLLAKICRYALTTTHNDMGLLQNSMPHSIQGQSSFYLSTCLFLGICRFQKHPMSIKITKTNHKCFSWSNHHFGSSNPMISNF